MPFSWSENKGTVGQPTRPAGASASLKRGQHWVDRAFSGIPWPRSWNGTVVSHRVHVLKEQGGGLPGVRTLPCGGKRRMD